MHERNLLRIQHPYSLPIRTATPAANYNTAAGYRHRAASNSVIREDRPRCLPAAPPQAGLSVSGRSERKVFQAPPIEWIEHRLENLNEVLGRRIAESARALRDLLGPIRLDLVLPDIGRPFNRAPTTIDTPALIETPSVPGAEGGSNFFAKVETPGLEPGSAAAQKVASTSVAGALISPSTSHAGRVVEGQLPGGPRIGGSKSSPSKPAD